MLSLVSFNCGVVKNILPVIADLFESVDFVLLQETWLLPVDLSLVDNVHQDYSAFSITSVDVGKLLLGRPFGGLSMLWHKTWITAVKR